MVASGQCYSLEIGMQDATGRIFRLYLEFLIQVHVDDMNLHLGGSFNRFAGKNERPVCLVESGNEEEQDRAVSHQVWQRREEQGGSVQPIYETET